ncbi:hypothetical protein M413DRAFT_447994 [Hebeloma cylindrosporum]|uniref:DUF6534 domain-containing protein n=1 Tax=Hebeloma cylindrosporum TaxID=76867 RepID=A0A0C3C1W7_HEBCY|nr:hypothetical protein M413DRAFT_447994 [Hebeloma cylindrosporum h7]
MEGVDIPRTFGALMIGGIVAAVFGGVVTAQTFAYFKNYPADSKFIKLLVGVVWFIDFCHTIFVSTSLWDHLIVHFGSAQRIDYIPWSLAMTIAFTAMLTFLVHLFFVFRIFKLSKRNFFFAVPLTLLTCARLCFACLTTAKLIKLRSLTRFVDLYTWSFTIGLSLSSLFDVLVTGLLCYLFFINQKENSSLNGVLDKLMLYSFENGSVTCAATLSSLVCWITSHKNNLIFMGLHFVISKFYANSLLATLNTRKTLQPTGHRSQHSGSGDRNLPIMFGDSFSLSRKTSEAPSTLTPAMRIQVEKTRVTVSDGTSRASDARRDSLAKTEPLCTEVV